MTEDQNARTKALLYLKEVIGDDAKFNRLNDGESIDVTGSLGGKYILYPNGHVIRLGKDKPKLGRIHENKEMPFPDVLATTYSWITHDEKHFIDNWGCGNIEVTNPNANISTENVDPEIAREIVREVVEDDSDEAEESWFDRHFIVIMTITPVFGVMLLVLFSVVMLFGNLGLLSQNTTSVATVLPSATAVINTTTSHNQGVDFLNVFYVALGITAIVSAIAGMFDCARNINGGE